LLLQVGDRETVLSDSTEFVRKARDAGVDATVQVWPNMIHVFQQFPVLGEAHVAVLAGGQFLRSHLAAATSKGIST
jgi:acetyl esterase/lipase